jgi:hypothetical protein
MQGFKGVFVISLGGTPFKIFGCKSNEKKNVIGRQSHYFIEILEGWLNNKDFKLTS